MSSPTFKVVYVPWYRPVRMLHKFSDGRTEFIGWIWRQRAYLVKNLHYGWVAFSDQQTPENIDAWFCQHCGASIMGSQRSKLFTIEQPEAGGDKS